MGDGKGGGKIRFSIADGLMELVRKQKWFVNRNNVVNGNNVTGEKMTYKMPFLVLVLFLIFHILECDSLKMQWNKTKHTEIANRLHQSPTPGHQWNGRFWTPFSCRTGIPAWTGKFP